MSSRKSAVAGALTACLAAWTVAALTPRDFPTGTFRDDAHYVVLAKSLRERHAYRTLNLPGEPAETKYPPLFPALLAPAWNPGLTGEQNLSRVRWVNLALTGPLAASLALAGSALGLTPVAASAAAMAGLLAPEFVGLWTLPMSEPLWLLLLALGVAAWARGREGAAVVALVLATWARTLAAPFLIAAIVLAWRRDRRRGIALALASALALAPWALWTVLHQGAVGPALLGHYGSYGAWLVEAWREDPVTALARVPLRNATHLLQSLGSAPAWWDWIPATPAIVLGAGLAVLLWLARRRSPLAVMGSAGYALMLLWWPFPVDRFVTALWPLVLVLTLVPLPPRARPAVLLVTLALATVGVAGEHGVKNNRLRGLYWMATREALAPLLEPDAMVAAPNPALYYLSLGVRAVPNGKLRMYRWYRTGDFESAWGADPDDLWEIVTRYRPRYVVTDGGELGGWPAADRLRRGCPGSLTARWVRSDGAALFRADPDATCAPGRSPPGGAGRGDTR